MRLIDADRLLQGYEDHDFIDTHIVWNAPTVDAVPVIRCKDCNHSLSGIDKYNRQYILCTRHENSYGVKENGFCAWAERKEE